MRSMPTSQQAKSASASGSGITGSITAGQDRSISMMVIMMMVKILPTSSGEYYEEYSTSLNDVSGGNGGGGRLMESVKLDGAQDSSEEFATKDTNGCAEQQSNSSPNEVGKARLALWGIAARNANSTSSSNAGTRSAEIPVTKKEPHQAGLGTSESRDREHQQQVDTNRFYVSPPPKMSEQQQQQIPQQQQQQQQRPQEYKPQINQRAVLFSQAQSLGQKAYDRGQKSYRNLNYGRDMYTCTIVPTTDVNKMMMTTTTTWKQAAAAVVVQPQTIPKSL